MKSRCLDSCFFAVPAAHVTSAGMAVIYCQQGLIQTVYFCLNTTRGVCEALFHNATLGLAPEIGWGVVPHWLLSVCGISSDVLWQFSSTTGHICLQSASAFHLCYPYFSCLSSCSRFDNCSQTNLIKLSFGLCCEIPQSQLILNGKRKDFCLRCPALYVRCAISCIIQIINKGLIILIPISL